MGLVLKEIIPDYDNGSAWESGTAVFCCVLLSGREKHFAPRVSRGRSGNGLDDDLFREEIDHRFCLETNCFRILRGDPWEEVRIAAGSMAPKGGMVPGNLFKCYRPPRVRYA